MSPIVVFHNKGLSYLTLAFDVSQTSSGATLTVTGPIGEFKTRYHKIEGPPGRALMNQVVDWLFNKATPAARLIVGDDEIWEELEQDFFDKYNDAMDFQS